MATKTAGSKDYQLAERLERCLGVEISVSDTTALRRAELTLQRWGERECGDGSDWHIERDETSGIPYLVYHGDGKSRRYRTPDKERGALKRIAAICERLGLEYYHQTDPRGCQLYIAKKGSGMNDSNYPQRGYPVCW